MFQDIVVAVEEVFPGKNVRKKLNLDQALINSIREVGIINPITVKQNGKGYEIVAGHRRYAAAKKAELQSVPCRLMGDEDADLISLIENNSRKNLNDFEYAEAFAGLSGHSDGYIAGVFGKTVTFVRQRRALTALHTVIKEKLIRWKVSFNVAESLTKLSHQQQLEIARDKTMDWDRGAWMVLRAVQDKTQLNSKNVVFELDSYEGESTSDLFSNEPDLLVFNDQEQARTLQEVALEGWRAKLADHPKCDFCHIISSQDKFWNTYRTDRVDSVHHESPMNPAHALRFLRTKAFRKYRADNPNIEIGIVCIAEDLARVRWVFPATLRSPKTKAKDLNSNGSTEAFTFGPTAVSAFAAHRTDLVRHYMLKDKGYRAVMAAVVCDLAGINMGREPHAWKEKIKDRYFQSKTAGVTIPMFHQNSDFLKVIKDPKLPEMFMHKVVGSIFDDGSFFSAIDVLAKHYKIRLAKHFIPTEQILKLMTTLELKKLYDEFKLSGTYKTKKELIGIIRAAFAHTSKKLTWCPPQFEFKTKRGTVEEELDDHIPA
tara:strand:+ start:1530 stop:3158 length:1629 start_codon:yes stop_codon:yes gene_type:complete